MLREKEGPRNVLVPVEEELRLLKERVVVLEKLDVEHGHEIIELSNRNQELISEMN